MNTEDALTWETFKKGDWNAYTRLYNSHFKLLNNYGYKFTRDVYLIEDSVHDLFVKLWKNKDNLGNPASVKNYLFKSFRNIIFRKLHKQPALIELNDDYQFSFELSFDHQVIAIEEETELRNKIKSVVEQLPARQREIIHLRFYEGFNYNEIADIMDISVNSTYKLLYKALSKMQVVLKLSKLAILLALLLLLQNQVRS